MRYICLTLLIIQSFWLSAQMQINGRLLYGHEWIEQDQAYYAIPVAEDGIYRLQAEQMMQAGIPVNSIEETEWQLWQNGMQVPILIGLDNDRTTYIEFKGSKNRIALDSFLTEGGKEDLLNHEYSLINDTATYYLSWKSGSFDNARIRALDPSLINPPVPEAYIWSGKKIVFTEGWTKPYTKISGANIYMSNFERGEGFASPLMQSYSDQIDLEHPYLQGPEGKLSIRFTGDYDPHEFSFTLNGEEVYRRSLPTFTMETLETELDSATMSAVFQFELKGELNSRDRFHMAHITADYPAQPHMPAAGSFSGRTENPMPYFEIPTSDDRQWYYYDLKHNIRYNFRYESGNQKLFTRESPAAHAFIWATEENIKSVPSPEKQEFRSWDAVLASDYIILTSERLYENGSDNPVQQYADYRAGEQGGEYSPAIVNVEDIYASFGYGVNRHPQAIRNFAHFLKAGNPNNPSVFIIGKGREYRFTRTAAELADPIHDSYFVPTFGYPSSDNLLFAASGEAAPIFPLGRLSIESKEEIVEYLDKVKAKESPVGVPTYENSYWRKRVVHLVGGSDNITTLLTNYMDDLQSTIKENTWEPEVESFNKKSQQAIERTVTDQIYDAINEGASLVTFFGHSATNALDFDINLPEKYDNYGKFPFLIALGCNSGNINTASESVGEIYSSFKNGGFIGSVATSTLGEVTGLYLFASVFYSNISRDAHRSTLGKMLQKSLQSRQQTDLRHAQQITLHGDPVLRLLKTEGADYTFDVNSFRTDPERVEINLDSIEVSIDLVNLGIRTNDTVAVNLKHQFGDQNVVYTEEVTDVQTRKTANFKIGLNREAKNVNRVQITIDPDDKIQEVPSPIAETNNSTEGLLNNDLSFFVFSNGVSLDWPYEYAIVDSMPLTLKFTTSNVLAPLNNYYLEMDTDHHFSSPFYVTEIQSKGGLIEHPIPNSLDSGKVYYWRVGIEAKEGEIVWEPSSFIYLPGKTGWNQSDDGQFLSNPECDFVFHRDTMFFKKEYVYAEIKNTYKGNGVGFPGILYTSTDFASVRQAFNSIDEGIGISVFDTLRNFYQTNKDGKFGSIDGKGQELHSYVYRTNTPEERQKAVSFLENHIPKHSYVFVYTIVNNKLRGDSLQFGEWAADTLVYGNSLIQTLEKYGAKNITSAIEENRHLYIYIFKKGYGYLNEGASNEELDFFKIGTTLTRRIRNGQLASDIINTPNDAIVSYKTQTWNSDDKARLQLKIFNSDKIELDSITTDTTTIIKSLDSLFENESIDKLIFKLHYADSANERTSPQLEYFRLYHQKLNDLAWAPKINYYISHDTITIGDTLHLTAGFIDFISSLKKDSIPVRIDVIQSNKVISSTITSGIYENEVYIVNTALLTNIWSEGYTTLRLQIDPLNQIKENNKINNLLNVELIGIKDKISPELKVYVNDHIIRNMEPVNLNPRFRFELTDFNAKTSLTHDNITYELIEPDNDTFNFNNASKKWDFTHSDALAKATLNLSPKLSKTGVYELKVWGTDQTGNESTPYNIKFIVPNNMEISNLYLYPNPTTGNVRIIYDLISRDKLSEFTLSLYNSLGQKVRTFRTDQLGPLKPGVSITTNSISLHGQSNLYPGVYFFRFEGSDQVFEGDIILIE